jgi:hypothetical protein
VKRKEVNAREDGMNGVKEKAGGEMFILAPLTS